VGKWPHLVLAVEVGVAAAAASKMGTLPKKVENSKQQNESIEVIKENQFMAMNTFALPVSSQPQEEIANLPARFRIYLPGFL